MGIWVLPPATFPVGEVGNRQYFREYFHKKRGLFWYEEVFLFAAGADGLFGFVNCPCGATEQRPHRFRASERFSDFSIRESTGNSVGPNLSGPHLCLSLAQLGQDLPRCDTDLEGFDIDLAGRLEPHGVFASSLTFALTVTWEPTRCVFTSITHSPIRKAEFSPAGLKPSWMGTTSTGTSIIPTAQGGVLCSMRRYHFAGGSTT